MINKSYLKNILGYKNQDFKKSYSQCGEDIIVDFILTHVLKIKNISYLDIGAHHPIKFSNTALFYEKGFSGINIEPDPTLLNSFLKKRVRDVNLNIAISNENATVDFFIMKNKALNTLSKDEALRMQKEEGETLEKIEKIEVITPNKLFNDLLKTKTFPTFLSIDVEGFELEILKTFEINNDFHPKILILETIQYSITGNSIKNSELIKYVETLGFYHYADTMINSIFVWKAELNGIFKW